MNPMAALDTPEVSGDVLLLIAAIFVVAIILMAAFLTFLYYRDRAEDKRSKK
jgi:heme/copper-type cytochrome/quinol oxidase subunit 2